VLPRGLTSIVVSITFDIPEAIFTEAALLHRRRHQPAELPRWQKVGGNQQSSGRTDRYALPAICMVVTMLSFTFFGDGVRDVVHPRLRWSRGSQEIAP